MIHRVIVILVIGLWAAGCKTSPPAPSEAGVGEGDALFAHGRRVYMVDCTRCHAPVKIGKLSEAQWQAIMPSMADESALTDAEYDAVLHYVLTLRRQMNDD